jgi:hypothetical protein
MLFKRLPAGTRTLRLAPPGHSVFKLRRQTQEDRICTLEAVALALHELGDPVAAGVLDRGLAVFNAAGLRQMSFLPAEGTKPRDASFYDRRRRQSGSSASDSDGARAGPAPAAEADTPETAERSQRTESA